MKRLKKTLALALALILALAMSTAVFAANESSITITEAPKGHTYEAYQIFTGDLVETTTSNSDGTEKTTRTLSNVKWGNGVSAITKDVTDTEGNVTPTTTAVETGKDATTEAEYVNGLGSADLKAYINSLTLDTSKAIELKSDNDGNYSATGLAAGYYVVKDKDGSVDALNGDEYTAYIVQVIGAVSTTAKTSQTTSQKKVMDINDSETTHNDGWQDSADYDIGDMVPFQLTAQITDNYDAFDTYYLAFHDTEALGLTFDPDSVKVYVEGNEVTDKSLYKVVTATSNNGTLPEGETFEVVFEDLKNVKAVTKGSVITVEYKSELNKDAVLGATGNKNTMYLEYSNNPNQEQDGNGNPNTGKTPKDTVIVFTYEVEINKVDQGGNALQGATFALYKKDASVTSEKTGYKEFDGEYYKILDYVEIDDTDTTVFTFRGIDDGDYILSETATPPGYNSISDIKFSVEAEHSVSADEPALTSLTGNVTTGSITINATSDYKTLKTTVENKSGSVLPSTGGTGRVLLYVVGAILVVGVGVILVSKKRAQQ
jgi:LPXTG-motif cell wall-anchored protein